MEVHQATPLPLGGPFRALLNIDSPRFMQGAHQPSVILMPGFYRQNRPLYMVSGTLLGRVVTVVDAARGVQRPTEDMFPEWFGLVATNFLVLLLGLWGMQRLDVVRAAPAGVVVAWMLLLLGSDVIKAFLWAPHTQMFAVTTPVVVALGVQWALQAKEARAWAGWRWGLALGLCGLCYESAILGLPAVVGALVWRAWRERAERRALASQAAVFVAVALAPTLVWQVVVRVVTGAWMHPPEIGQHRELVWMLDALKEGPGALAWATTRNLAMYLGAVIAAYAPILPTLAIVGGVALLARGRLADELPAKTPQERAIWVTFVLFFGFFALLGYYTPRLAWNALPLLLIGVSGGLTRGLGALPPRVGRGVEVVLVLAAVVQAVGEVRQEGPYSL